MPGKPTVSTQLQMLRCQVEAGAYAFDTTAVRSIHRWESVDASQPAAGGLGTLGGKPVYRLAHLLGLGEEPAATAGPVLMLDEYAVQVDSVSRPRLVAESQLRRLPRPAQGAQGRVAGLVRLEGELTLLLDPRRLAEPGEASPPPWPCDEPWVSGAFTTTDKLLCFLPPGHGEHTYLAVSYRQAVEVALGLKLSRLRSSEPWLAGLVDWRDRAVPVVDLAGLLGVEPSARVDVSRTLIARAPRSGELFAFPADHLAPLPLPLSEDSMLVKTIDPPSPYIRAAYTLTDGYLFLPDLDRLSAPAI